MLQAVFRSNRREGRRRREKSFRKNQFGHQIPIPSSSYDRQYFLQNSSGTFRTFWSHGEKSLEARVQIRRAPRIVEAPVSVRRRFDLHVLPKDFHAIEIQFELGPR